MIRRWRDVWLVLALLTLIGCVGAPYETRLGAYLVVKPAPGESLEDVAARIPAGSEGLPLIRSLNPAELTSAFSPLLVPSESAFELGLRVDGYPVVPTLCWRFLKGENPSVERLKQDIKALEAAGYTFLAPKVFLSFLKMKASVPERSVVVSFEVEDAKTFRPLIPFLVEKNVPGLLFVDALEVEHGEALQWDEIKTLLKVGLEPAPVLTNTKGLETPQGKESLEAYAIRVRKSLKRALDALKVRGDSLFVAMPQKRGSVVCAVLKSFSVSGVYALGTGGNAFFSDPFSLVRQEMKDDAPMVPVFSLIQTFQKADLSW
ncbi:MAG: hypothetical protein MI742_06520 [Desulfobacterales bacterium]|nr:hypothetical protein [Desulfobacterales bacterium]